jgi:hypothetical protein
MSGALILSGAVTSDLPSFIAEDREKDSNDDLMSQYLVPPRIKTIQRTAGEQFSAFKPGSLVLMPSGVPLTDDVDQPFHITPLLYYPEYLVVNPIETKETLPMIRDRTLDPKSEIAVIARDPDKRDSFECPEMKGKHLKYKEVHTFIVVIAGRPGIAGLPVAMSFSGMEARVGSQFIAKIKMRGAKRYACIFEAFVPKTLRKNAKGSWYGIDIQNPTANSMPPFVQDAEEYAALKAMSERLLAQYEQNLIQVDYNDADADPDDANVAAADAKY